MTNKEIINKLRFDENTNMCHIYGKVINIFYPKGISVYDINKKERFEVIIGTHDDDKKKEELFKYIHTHKDKDVFCGCDCYLYKNLGLVAMNMNLLDYDFE